MPRAATLTPPIFDTSCESKDDVTLHCDGLFSVYISTNPHCLKITQNVVFEFLILAFFTNFCPIKTDLSGNTV